MEVKSNVTPLRADMAAPLADISRECEDTLNTILRELEADGRTVTGMVAVVFCETDGDGEAAVPVWYLTEDHHTSAPRSIAFAGTLLQKEALEPDT